MVYCTKMLVVFLQTELPIRPQFFTIKKKIRKGNEWGRSSFHRLFENEKYIGVYKFDSIRTKNGIPPIISKELFYTVNNHLKNKKGPQGRHSENGDYLLTGKLFCGECGAAMVGISGTG